MIDTTEQEDFNAILHQYGFNLPEFGLAAHRDKIETSGIYTITGTVTVRRETTNINKVYSAGHGTAWVIEFENDLKNGYYGRPDALTSE